MSGGNNVWHDLDVTALVNQHHAGAFPNYGIGLYGVSGNSLVFTQSESTCSAFVPQLVISGTNVPEPTSLFLLGGMAVAVCARRRKN